MLTCEEMGELGWNDDSFLQCFLGFTKASHVTKAQTAFLHNGVLYCQAPGLLLIICIQVLEIKVSTE